jgi:hypothetical protein
LFLCFVLLARSCDAMRHRIALQGQKHAAICSSEARCGVTTFRINRSVVASCYVRRKTLERSYARPRNEDIWQVWGVQPHSLLTSALQYLGHAVAQLVEAGRSRARFPMVSLEFFIDTNLPAALRPWDRLILLTELSTRNIF